MATTAHFFYEAGVIFNNLLDLSLADYSVALPGGIAHSHSSIFIPPKDLYHGHLSSLLAMYCL